MMIGKKWRTMSTLIYANSTTLQYTCIEHIKSGYMEFLIHILQ